MSDNRQVNAEYIARINLAMDYLETHLDQPLTLAHIAAMAFRPPPGGNKPR